MFLWLMLFAFVGWGWIVGEVPWEIHPVEGDPAYAISNLIHPPISITI